MKEIDEPIPSLIDLLPQRGKLVWIGLRPKRKTPLISVESARVTAASGLEGDHFNSKSTKRQVTLIQGEHMDGVASMLGKNEISPVDTRRNLVVRGINLLALRNRKFRIGEVVLEGTGYCHPCSRMEENLGEGGYNAMRGHGGITTKVINEGEIKIGDTIELLS